MTLKQQADDLRLMSREFLTEFLTIYRKEECLWQVRNRGYSDKNMRARSYKKLVDKMREADKNADENYVKRKINALRTNYRAEWNKLQHSITAGETPVYKPKLWYFKLLSFLDGLPRKENDMNVPTHSISNGLPHEDEEFCPSEFLDCGETLLIRNKIEENPTPQISRKRRQLKSEYILEKSSDILDRCEQDECDLVGKNVASKLRRLPSDMRIYAEKLLNDVLFEAQLGMLNRESCVVTQYNLD